MTTTNRVFVDGKVHVRRVMCATCVFRPGNLMGLKPGRLEDLVAGATSDQAGSIPCHEHLYRSLPVEPVCAGFYREHATPVLRLAAAMGLIEWVPGRPVG